MEEKTRNKIVIENPKRVYMKKVKVLGNGAYIGVPKDLIGKCLYVIVPQD